MNNLLVAACIVFLVGSTPALAKGGRGGSGTSYGGGKHTSSHGGHYSGGKGSSHKGGSYRNKRTGNQYGNHR